MAATSARTSSSSSSTRGASAATVAAAVVVVGQRGRRGHRVLADARLGVAGARQDRLERAGPSAAYSRPRIAMVSGQGVPLGGEQRRAGGRDPRDGPGAAPDHDAQDHRRDSALGRAVGAEQRLGRHQGPSGSRGGDQVAAGVVQVAELACGEGAVQQSSVASSIRPSIGRGSPFLDRLRWGRLPRLVREGQVGRVAGLGRDQVGHGVRAAPRGRARRCTSARGVRAAWAASPSMRSTDPAAQVALAVGVVVVNRPRSPPRPSRLDVARLAAAGLGEQHQPVAVDVDPDRHRVGRAVGQRGGEVGEARGPRQARATLVGQGGSSRASSRCGGVGGLPRRRPTPRSRGPRARGPAPFAVSRYSTAPPGSSRRSIRPAPSSSRSRSASSRAESPSTDPRISVNRAGPSMVARITAALQRRPRSSAARW